MPEHHIDHQILTEYATGALSRPVAMLVSSHIEMCPECSTHVHAFEAIGGGLLEQIAPAEIDDSGLTAVMARLDDTEEVQPAPKHAENLALVAGNATLPQSLRSAINNAPAKLRWRRRGIGLQEIVLPGSDAKIRASLMRISPGSAMPTHTHGGTELTLVLSGGFSDAAGHYQPGDVALADAGVNHRPIADQDGECLCFAVVDGGIRLSGAFGRLANFMLRL